MESFAPYRQRMPFLKAIAVENAAKDLKALATGVIGDNNSDSVAKWLNMNARIF